MPGRAVVAAKSPEPDPNPGFRRIGLLVRAAAGQIVSQLLPSYTKSPPQPQTGGCSRGPGIIAGFEQLEDRWTGTAAGLSGRTASGVLSGWH
jgi:hypothetical protein